MLNRRQVLRHIFSGALALPLFSYGQSPADPWPQSALLEPAALNKLLMESAPLVIFCVGFPPLYRAKHLPHALLAGPTSKPDGMQQLERAADGLKDGARIVLYCGCCPMVHCPNIRPAYEALVHRGFKDVRVLDLPHNFHTDWTAKGYPTESSEI